MSINFVHLGRPLISNPSTEIIDETSKTVSQAFPKAIPINLLVQRVTGLLEMHGFNRETTLLGTALCCDELNRDLEHIFTSQYGNNFSMGGLAGFAFGGVTSFKAMATHIPDGGSCLIVFGPHIGIDSSGIIGKADRQGRKDSNACCGSAIAAAAYVSSVRAGAVEACMPVDCVDMQQFFVGNILLAHVQRLENSHDADIELPMVLFEEQEAMIHRIVSAGIQIGVDEKIALLGGIQINTPKECSDFFLPLLFEILDSQGETDKNLLILM